MQINLTSCSRSFEIGQSLLLEYYLQPAVTLLELNDHHAWRVVKLVGEFVSVLNINGVSLEFVCALVLIWRLSTLNYSLGQF